MRQLVVRFRLKRGSTQQKCFYVHDTQDENKKENWKKKKDPTVSSMTKQE